MSRAVRALGLVVALVALALALTAGVAYARRVSLAEWWLLDWIAARGVSPAALRVTRVDARGIAIADLAVGAPDAPDLAIAEIDAGWSLAGLRERRLDALRVAGIELRGTQRDGQLSLGALDALLAGDTSADAAPALPAGEIAIEAARLRISTPQGVATGTLGGSVRGVANETIEGEFDLALDGAGLRARGALEVSGSLDAPAFHALLEVEPGLPIAGRVEVRGQVAREKGERVFDASVALRDASFTSDALRMSGVNGVIALRGPPLHTPKKQILSLGAVDVGVPLTEGLVEFTLRRDGTVAVALAMLHFAEGELRAKDVVLDLDAKQTAVTLQARGIDLTALLAQVDLPGIEGSGTLDGDVPVVRTGKSLVVKGGDLHATPGGGKIRYMPTEDTRALAASRPNDLGLAVDAFSNFQYEILEAKLDGELQGEMKIGLHVRGANPEFQDGRPVELNLNLEARLADLVRDAGAAYRVPAVVEERLRAFSEGEAR
jgi:hypothetical protein